MPHATAGLVRLDSFFATHRPLLELPLRLHQRKTASGAAVKATEQYAVEEISVQEHSLEATATETAEVVDLDSDGQPTGAAYRVMLGGTPAMEPLRSAEEELELEAQEEMNQEDEHEAVMAELEEDHPDPYDAWLLGEPEGASHPPAIARYLASHPPFTAPAPPRASSAAKAITAASSLAPETRANLSYLRPHSAQTLTANSERCSYSSVFAGQVANPLDPNTAKQQVDRFLSAASLTHRWHAQRDYDKFVTEQLQAAEQTYTGQKPTQQKVEQGAVRLWSEKEGWITINVKRETNSSLFLPAELVDLTWADEMNSAVKKLGEIQLDSTKRKRKKKMTKHKYKKRRKAQRALRQRLGK